MCSLCGILSHRKSHNYLKLIALNDLRLVPIVRSITIKPFVETRELDRSFAVQ